MEGSDSLFVQEITESPQKRGGGSRRRAAGVGTAVAEVAPFLRGRVQGKRGHRLGCTVSSLWEAAQPVHTGDGNFSRSPFRNGALREDAGNRERYPGTDGDTFPSPTDPAESRLSRHPFPREQFRPESRAGVSLVRRTFPIPGRMDSATHRQKAWILPVLRTPGVPFLLRAEEFPLLRSRA